jgi:hypothetical protein
MVQEVVEPIILREGDNFYTLPSDADNIIDILDMNNIKILNDKIEYRKKVYSIQIEENVHHLVLIGQEVLNKVLNTALLTQSSNQSLELELKSLKEKMMSIAKMLLAERKRATQMSIENKSYRENNNNFKNPLLVLKELFNSGKISLYSPGVPPTKFKVLTYKKNKADIDYWMSLFEEWCIIDSTQSNHYKLMVTYNSAKGILKNKIGAE